MVILIGPSGVGKSSFLDRALRDYPRLKDTVTYTTRAMRQGESEGHPYHFVSRAKFEELVSQGFFVEHAEVHGNLYGTPLHQLEETWAEGNVVIMDVDVQGALTFQGRYPKAKTIFILPPSIDSLRQRILKREGKSPKDLELRLRNAEAEMRHSSRFGHSLVNDHFESAYGELQKLIEDYLGS